MQGHNAKPPQNLDTPDDIELVQLARRKGGNAFRSIVQRSNRRLCHVGSSVVPDDSEAENVAQEAYVRTFGSLGQFRGDPSLATWLTRIALNAALGCLPRHRSLVDLTMLDAQPSGKLQVIPFPLMPRDFDLGRAAAHRQIRHPTEQVIDGPPEIFWLVFAITSNGVYRRAKP
jgi:RNA polymerase sigma-70 factor (ECF subfamily)